MKDAVIAKVAAQAADFYKSAYSSSQVQSVKQVLEKVANEMLQNCLSMRSTVKPLLSGQPLSSHPLLGGQLSKSHLFSA